MSVNFGACAWCALRVCTFLPFSLFLLGATEPVLARELAGPDARQLRFITANAEFTLMHEMGHLLINELKMPVLGREEDAADQLGFMGLFLMHDKQRDADFYQKLVDVAHYWRLEWQRPKPSSEEIKPWDSHALDAQRFYNIACLAFGSDPDHLEWIIEATDLPEERAFYCDQEYEQVRYAVQWLETHFRRQPGSPVRHRINIQYDSPPRNLEHGASMLAKVKASGELEAVAAKATEAFDLPRDMTLRLMACGSPDSWYDSQKAEVIFCYERLEHFYQLSGAVTR